jgi:long-chain acyl-CoA synthetase
LICAPRLFRLVELLGIFPPYDPLLATRIRIMNNLFDQVVAISEKYPNDIALVADGGNGCSYTYLQLVESVTRFSTGLAQRELFGQSEIGLLSENRPEWCIAYLSIIAAGGTVVPIDATLTMDEIAQIISLAGLATVIVSAKFEPQLRQAIPNLRIIGFESSSQCHWKSILATGTESFVVKTSEVAVLIYTSGTTGSPKAVELTHANLIANLEGIRESVRFGRGDIFLSVLPLHHTFESTCGFLTPLTRGAAVVYARSLKSKEILEDIGKNGVTVMCGVPLLYEKMYHSIHRGIESAPVIKRLLFKLLFALSSVGWKLGLKWGRGLFRSMRTKAGLGQVRIFVSGGAAIPPHIVRFFNLIGFSFLQGYGMTECSPVISVHSQDDIEFGSVGRPLRNVEVRIMEEGNDGIGEIVVRSPSITRGYRGNPEKTAELLRDGWLYTGDLGRLRDGHLWITGRRKNVIISGAGKNIYPEELEERLMESDFVLEAVVFGRKRESKLGEEIRAILVPDLEELRVRGVDPQNPDRDLVQKEMKEVVDSVNLRMADFKRVETFDVLMTELEKNSSKKVKRFLYK